MHDHLTEVLHDVFTLLTCKHRQRIDQTAEHQQTCNENDSSDEESATIETEAAYWGLRADWKGGADQHCAGARNNRVRLLAVETVLKRRTWLRSGCKNSLTATRKMQNWTVSFRRRFFFHPAFNGKP